MADPGFPGAPRGTAPSRAARSAEALARALIRIPSGPSPCAGERRAALELERWARSRPAFGRERGGLRVLRRPLPADRHGRFNLLLLLPGNGDRDVLFTGHVDTVGTADFGDLRAHACDPRALERRRPMGARWLQGRGSLDMKSGLAAAAAALEELARVPRERRSGTVGLLATADEENASAGVAACAGWRELLARPWRAVISAELTAPPPPGRAGRLHFGTVGKCLVGALLKTVSGHAAERRRSPDAATWAAELVRDFAAPAGGAAAPAVLRARDLKGAYDTQLPDAFVVYFNVLGDPLDPAGVLRRLDASARRAYREAGGRALGARSVRQASPGDARPRSGEEPWDAALRVALERSPAGPGATLFFCPPYYASRPAGLGDRATQAALRSVARAERLCAGGRFPYISDLSLFGAALGPEARAFRRACPVHAPPQGLGLDCVLATLGPWGRGLHRPDEAVRRDFAFARLPGIYERCVREIWKRP